MSDELGKAKAAAQGPLHAVRGAGEQEKMLRNARAEYAEEAQEIATYTVIDVARDGRRRQGDGEARARHPARGGADAEVPRDAAARADGDVAHDKIPVSEIEGKAARRTAADSKSGSARS